MPESLSLQVAVDAPAHTSLRAPLTYLSEAPLTPGTLVRVPFGAREVTGVVWGGVPSTDAQVPDPALGLRPLQHALTSLPPLGHSWRRLVEFTAAYYQRGIGEVALSVLPPELRKLDDTQMRQRIARLHKAWALPQPATLPTVPLPELDEAQTQVLADLRAAQGHAVEPTVLLNGFSGSGKTEI